MAASSPPPDKRSAVEQILEAGPCLLRFDPTLDGVEVPPALRDGPVLALKISRGYANPLSLDDDAVRQRLTFSVGAWSCAIPWPAIFSIGPPGGDGGWMWPGDLPASLMESLLDTVREGAESVDAEPAPGEPPTDEPPGTVRRGHLRLVKS